MVLAHIYVILQCNFNYTGYIHITLVPHSTPFTPFALTFLVSIQFSIYDLQLAALYDADPFILHYILWEYHLDLRPNILSSTLYSFYDFLL